MTPTTEYYLYRGIPPHVPTDTSRQAALEILPHVSRLAREVYQLLKRTEGATCWGVEQDLGMSHQTASARIRELVLSGLAEATPARRRTGSGRLAIVWRAK